MKVEITFLIVQISKILKNQVLILNTPFIIQEISVAFLVRQTHNILMKGM